MRVPMIGICRHRIATDGQGVTTLVAFLGCPLRCKSGYNTQADMDKSRKQLETMGFSHFDCFEYVSPHEAR